MMMLLILFAFLTSVFLMPAIIAAWQSSKRRIKGGHAWRDHGEVPILESKVIDAGLLDK